MAVFSIVIRGKRNDGYYPVYICVNHKSKPSYMKTTFVVSDRGLKKSYNKIGKEKLEVNDKLVLRECMNLISGYARRLNDIDSDQMTVQEVVQFLSSNESDISFSEFAEEYITDMQENGRERSGKNYALAVKRLHEYLNKDNIKFDDLTFQALTNWINSMLDSPRKRNLYPTCIKTMYKAALFKYNDEERDIIRIKRNPFNRVKIPPNLPGAKRSVEIEILRRFFNTDITETYNNDWTKEKIGKDVCKIMFCLAGINSADLYDLPVSAFSNGILHYKRKKTRDKSHSGAYTEIKIPEIIKPLLEEYKGKKRLFCFSERYGKPEDFTSIVAKGCKRVVEKAGIDKKFTPYSLRHSWATIARNECGASMDDIALALTHSSAHKVTEIYVDTDYTIIDRINEKVISLVFNSEHDKLKSEINNSD